MFTCMHTVGENNDNGLPYEDSQFDQLSVASESDEVQSSIQVQNYYYNVKH